MVHRRAAGSCSCRPWSVCEPGRARRGTGAGSGGAWPHWWLFMAISKLGADAVPSTSSCSVPRCARARCSYFCRSHFPGYLRHPPAQSSYTLLLLQLPGPRYPRPAERRRRRRLGTGLSRDSLGGGMHSEGGVGQSGTPVRDDPRCHHCCHLYRRFRPRRLRLASARLTPAPRACRHGHCSRWLF